MFSKLLDWLLGPKLWWICVDRPGNTPDRKLYVLQSRRVPTNVINWHRYFNGGYSTKEAADKDCLLMKSTISPTVRKPFERRMICVAKVPIREGQFVTTGDIAPLSNGDMSR